MKLILTMISVFICMNLFSQTNKSEVDSSTREGLINELIINKSKADFPELIDEINQNTRFIRILPAAVIVKNKDNCFFNLDLLKNLWIGNVDQGGYILYNMDETGYNIIGSYLEDSLLAIAPQIIPPITDEERSLLNDITKYYNLDSVMLLRVAGVAGYCIIVDNAIWIINGNERTELKSYIKFNYLSLNDFRNNFLIEEKNSILRHKNSGMRGEGQ